MKPNKDDYDDLFDKEDWDEDDWEKFMEINDKKIDEYMKKLDDVGGDPEKLIDKLMEFDKPKNDCIDNCEDCGERFECYFYELEQERKEWEAMSADEKNELIQESTNDLYVESGYEFSSDEDDFEKLPVYRKAFDYAIFISDFLNPILENIKDDKEYLNLDDDIKILAEHSSLIGAKIAGGTGIGYDRFAINGNIANVKRALKSANLCLNALNNLERKEIITKSKSYELINRTIDVRDSVIHRILELRKRAKEFE
jgi:hypothetical protein